MRPIYRLRRRDDSEYRVDASRPWGLPGVRCPVCQETWANVGLQYPTVDLSAFPGEPNYRKARAVDLKEYERLRDDLLEWLPERTVVRPGTEFGPLRGVVRGKVGMIEWPNSWTILMRSDVHAELRRRGIDGLRGEAAVLDGLRGNQLIDLELAPYGVLHPLSIPHTVPPPCKACGRWGITVPDELALAHDSVPIGVDLFRGLDCTTAVFATERLVEGLRTLGTTEFIADRVDVGP